MRDAEFTSAIEATDLVLWSVSTPREEKIRSNMLVGLRELDQM